MADSKTFVRQYKFEKEVSDSVLFFENTSHCSANLVHEE